MERAAQLSRHNRQYGNIDTVLFFDEANTTEAIGLVKEIMCDHTVNGQPLGTLYGLKLIAACNPYRKYVIYIPYIPSPFVSIFLIFKFSWENL